MSEEDKTKNTDPYIAGEDLRPGQPCYISPIDGKVYKSMNDEMEARRERALEIVLRGKVMGLEGMAQVNPAGVAEEARVMLSRPDLPGSLRERLERLAVGGKDDQVQ